MKNQSPAAPSALMTEEQAAEFLNVSTHYLRKDRRTDRKVPYVSMSSRLIRYQRAALERMVEAHITGGVEHV